ncbi:hypothetical protein [Corynebacterium kroppenstedtii]|uniref:hypothetical protein n=1 Tax=Corynebacterium kroppenstedtii TaxID=161879 RepID=UPI00195DCDD5|nr:hypothetical protein [Corynebacterium kroppenstedtii]QRQ64978.1 hypothetical protein I6J23_00200 [Corynebacterium kroppenstedtii]
MRFRIVISGQELLLEDTKRNQLVVDKIQEGIHPGLVTLDTKSGSVSANLSEAVPYVLFKSKAERSTRPNAMIL